MTAPTKAERPHGYARYNLDACRCDVCKTARQRYDKRVTMARIAGTWRPWTDAAPVREHLAVLSAAGIGYKRAAELAGLHKSVVSAIIRGKGAGRPPAELVRPETAAKILAVRPEAAAPAPGALVSPVGAERRLQALVCLGWSMAELARRIGWTNSNIAGMIARGTRIEYGTDLMIRDLYDELWMTPAPPGYSATRSRNEGQRRGWFGPLAWDDDTIDDPAAYPAVMPPTGPVLPGVNELAIQHAAAGHTTPASLDYISRLEWIARMRAVETPARQIGRQLGISDTTVLEMARKAAYYAENLGTPAVAA